MLQEPLIRENITPIGDGNNLEVLNTYKLLLYVFIRENITPIGDGN